MEWNVIRQLNMRPQVLGERIPGLGLLELRQPPLQGTARPLRLVSPSVTHDGLAFGLRH